MSKAKDEPVKQTRWLRTRCPDCAEGNIVSVKIKPIKGSKGTGDVFIDGIRCPKHERTHIGLPAEPVRRADRNAKAKAQPAEREPRNCGGDKRTYTPDF